MFALSVNLLQLVLFEILGVLDYRCAHPFRHHDQYDPPAVVFSASVFSRRCLLTYGLLLCK